MPCARRFARPVEVRQNAVADIGGDGYGGRRVKAVDGLDGSCPRRNPAVTLVVGEIMTSTDADATKPGKRRRGRGQRMQGISGAYDGVGLARSEPGAGGCREMPPKSSPFFPRLPNPPPLDHGVIILENHVSYH